MELIIHPSSKSNQYTFKVSDVKNYMFINTYTVEVEFNDGNKENPKPVNLRGRQGPQGAPGSDADILPITNLELEKLLI